MHLLRFLRDQVSTWFGLLRLLSVQRSSHRAEFRIARNFWLVDLDQLLLKSCLIQIVRTLDIFEVKVIDPSRWLFFCIKNKHEFLPCTKTSNFWKRNSRISNGAYSKIRVLIANDENWSIGMNTKRRGRERGSLNPTLIRNNRNVCRYPVENTRARSGKKENRERIGKVGGESPGFRYRRDLSVPYFEFKRLTPRIHGCRMQNTDSRW